MNVRIRPLRPEDIGWVSEIEHQAFPTLWPPTPFKGELNSPVAKYLVAWEPEQGESTHMERVGPEDAASTSSGSLFGRLLHAVKGRLSSDKSYAGLGYSLLGFVGLWFTGEEAHITGIAVEEASQGEGIGELLLMGSIELAIRRGATVVTLETRVSNHVAQSLYQKHGFQKVGIRKGYYSDNREDAAIMTTHPIDTHAYRTRFQELREAYRQRHGEIMIELA